MSGSLVWDAILWAVIGLVLGVVLARWSGPRSALVVALIVALAGFILVPVLFALQGADARGPAVMVILASVPMTLGLALGAALARLGRRR